MYRLSEQRGAQGAALLQATCDLERFCRALGLRSDAFISIPHVLSTHVTSDTANHTCAIGAYLLQARADISRPL
jgi:hypothetical protein